MLGKRVVVTGIGVISSIGIGKEQFWSSLTNGKSGISRVSSFDTDEFCRHYGGEIKHFNIEDQAFSRNIRLPGRSSQFAIAASDLAIKDAGLTTGTSGAHKTGVILGTTFGEQGLEQDLCFLASRQTRRIKKHSILSSFLPSISSSLARHFGFSGPNYIFPIACSAGNYAIAYAFDLIKGGVSDCILCGAADYFSRATFASFSRLYAMAPRICQPFDKNRTGMLLGEGSGMLLLESLDSALRRGSRMHAEILGYGLSCDAYHSTAPRQEGLEKAMSKALKASGVQLGEVGYICAHGTGTNLNDSIECAAIKNVFGPRYKKIAISSIKSMIGHAMSAASSIEAATCCLVVKTGIIPPTINYKTPDHDCDIDCVPNKSRKKTVRIALNNSFAFGGNNCCLVIKAME